MAHKNKYFKWILAMIVMCLVLLFINKSWAFGALLACISLLLLNLFRDVFYKKMFEDESFSVGLYVMYILFVFIIVWLPLLVAFMYSKYINPLAFATVIFIDRVRVFVMNYFARSE